MNSTIPFIDLTRAIRPIEQELQEALSRVVESGYFLRGAQVAAFEEEWAAYCGQSYCVACNSGTDALTIAALALDCREAEIQANTLPLTAIGLHKAGARVSLREVDATGRIADISKHSVPVLLYGRQPSPAEANCSIFDAAHAHGWRPPSHAVACWSFYPTKTLGAFGDAGAITTNDRHLAEMMQALTGADDRLHDARQITSRMDEMQAAVLRVKLRQLDAWLRERATIATWYKSHLPQSAWCVSDSDRDLQHLFVIKVPDRDGLMNHLHAHGVGTKVHFPVPLNTLDAPWADRSANLPGASKWCASVCSLPCYPGLTRDEVLRVCEHVTTYYLS